VAQFKRGKFSACNAPHLGGLKTVKNPEIIDQIHELILEGRHISAKSITEQLNISRERVISIIYEDLDKRKHSGKWVPKYLTRIENVNEASRLSNLWNIFVWRDPNDFLSRLVTMDETWLYHYDPETNQ
jgi:hypothetical protein